MLCRRFLRPAGVMHHSVAFRTTHRIFSSASRPALSPFQPPLSSFSVPEDRKPRSLVQDAVDHFNVALKDHTVLTFGVLMASDMVSIYGTYSLIQLSGVTISPEFALAFACSRPLRRVRFPLNIAAAAFVSKYLPELTKVKLSAAYASVLGKFTSKRLPASETPSIVQKGLSTIGNAMDKYGACYMIGSRLMGLTVVSSIYMALVQGVDILPLLAQYGMGDIGTAIGTWAAAVTMSSVFYPVTLGMAGYVVPVVAKVVKLSPPTHATKST